jgi:transcription elongation factor GreB
MIQAVDFHAVLGGLRACYDKSMSKAFTKENEEPDDDLNAEADAGQPAGAKNYITPAGYRRLRDEFAELWEKERPRLVDTIAWAAGNGDRSENGDYLYGKKRLREVDRRIRFLSKRLEHAEVVDNSNREAEQIFFGATVTVADAQGEARTISIVGIDEVDPMRGRVSWISPIAKALIKAREGDTVMVQTPGGAQPLDVLAIRYEELP